MLRLLLDIHVPPRVAAEVRRHRPGLHIARLRDWQNGTYREARDESILIAANREELTLLTFDVLTIAPLAKEWGEAGHEHAGVIFVSRNTVAQDDIGGLVKAILRVLDESGELEWRNRVSFLQPA